MTPPTYAGPGTGFADEVALDSPELAVALEAARAELGQVPVPALDDRLEALLGSDDGTVVTLAGSRRTARRVAIAGGTVVAMLAATTGLAAASVLPAPVQRVVAEAAEHVGIDLPRPDRDVDRADRAVVRAPAGAVKASTSAVPGVPSGTSPAGTAATTDRSRPAAEPSASAATARRSAPSVGATPLPTAAAQPNTPVAGAADVDGFRKAIVAYVTCLRSGRRDCVRPRPSEFGLVPSRPTAPPTTAAPTEPSAPELAGRLAAFRAAVLRYAACVANRDRRAAASCARPDPAAFGLPGWPAGLPVPPRPAWPTSPTMSSPPVSRIPPAPDPGVTDTSTRRSSSHGTSAPERVRERDSSRRANG
jgi:hypothetical protein